MEQLSCLGVCGGVALNKQERCNGCRGGERGVGPHGDGVVRLHANPHLGEVETPAWVMAK